MKMELVGEHPRINIDRFKNYREMDDHPFMSGFINPDPTNIKVEVGNDCWQNRKQFQLRNAKVGVTSKFFLFEGEEVQSEFCWYSRTFTEAEWEKFTSEYYYDWRKHSEFGKVIKRADRFFNAFAEPFEFVFGAPRPATRFHKLEGGFVRKKALAFTSFAIPKDKIVFINSKNKEN